MDRSSILVLAAWAEARQMARLASETVEPARGAVMLGTTLGGSLNGFAFYGAMTRQGRRRSTLLRDYSLTRARLSYLHRDRFLRSQYGVFHGLYVVELGFDRGLRPHPVEPSRFVITGGFDTLSQISRIGFSVMRNVSPDLCRHFEHRRAGLVLGERAALLVIEAKHTAARRRAVWRKSAGTG